MDTSSSSSDDLEEVMNIFLLTELCEELDRTRSTEYLDVKYYCKCTVVMDTSSSDSDDFDDLMNILFLQYISEHTPELRGDNMTSEGTASDGSQVQSELVATKCDGDKLMQFQSGDIVWIRTSVDSWWPGQVVDEGRVIFTPKKKAKNGVLVRMYGCYEYLYVDPVKCSTEFEKYLKKGNLSFREAFQNTLEKDLSRLRAGGTSKRKASESRGTDGPIGKKKQDSTGTLEMEDSLPHASSGELEEVGALENANTVPSIKATRAKKLKQNETPRRVSSRLKNTPKQQKNEKDGEASKSEMNQGVLGKAKTGTSRGKNLKQRESVNPKQDVEEKTPIKSPRTGKSSAPEESPSVLSERRMKVMQGLGLIAPQGSPYKRNGFVIASPLL